MKRAMFTVLPFSFLLACTGPMGEDGAKGDKGAMGDMGAMGAKGDMGSRGQDGQNGASGQNGQAGQAGAAGLNCWDLNGNGVCDLDPEAGTNEDVDDSGGCNAFDCAGPEGQRGANGANGANGEKGDRGDPGLNGAPGQQGEKGDKGDTGATGEKGDRGDTGATGEKGDKGDRGDTGPQGTFTAGACTFTTGQLIAGTNAQGGRDTSTVTCPAGAFAVGIFPVQQAWNLTATCQPISFRIDNRTVGTDWFSTPRNVGTGCLSNSFATATLCCQ